MTMTSIQENFASVDAMIKFVEIKAGKVHSTMLQTQRVMVACTTFRIMIQSQTIRFTTTMISLPQKCAAYTVEAAKIQKAYKIHLDTIVALMSKVLSIVANLTTMILFQQKHVVFVRIGLNQMMTILKKIFK